MYISDDLIESYTKKFKNTGILYKWHNICPFLIKQFPKYINDKSFVYEKRIEVSISQYYNKSVSNVIVDNYSNLNELFTLCMLSSYIPVLSGFSVPKRNNLITFDGYFTKPNFEDRKVVLSIEN